MMTKTGVVKAGKTPSAVSGEVSEFIKSGEALRDGEEPPMTEEDLKDQIEMEDQARG